MPEDIYNADETRLFWLAIPSATLGTQQPKGKKKKKDRITILVTANGDGSHKLPHWIVGKAMNPRCFGRHNERLNGLQVVYRANKTTWVTTTIFLEFLSWFANEIRHKKPGRRVLFFLDSFSAYESAARQFQAEAGSLLSNLRLEFLPKNATSLYQSMD